MVLGIFVLPLTYDQSRNSVAPYLSLAYEGRHLSVLLESAEKEPLIEIFGQQGHAKLEWVAES